MDTIPQLPQDVVVNILARLPVKHLTQLKCVCKSWLSLISDPQFAKLQLAQSKKNGRSRILRFSDPLQMVGCKDSVDDHDLDRIFHLEYPAVMRETPEFLVPVSRGSCNGLICVEPSGRRIFIWNPTIGEGWELANYGNCDPTDCFFLGFGYDFSTDDYKILRFAPRREADDDPLAYGFEIFALKSNEWCKVPKPTVHYIFAGIFKRGTFLHGGLHWIVRGPTNMYLVLVLDMVEEKFYELVELPNSIQEPELIRAPESKLFWSDLISSGDSLFVFFEDDDSGLEGWHLKEYGIQSSWTKIFSNRCSNIPEFDEFWVKVLHCTKTGKVVLDFGSSGLIWYDPKENTWETVSLRQDLKVPQHAIYVESLIVHDWYRPNNA